MIQAYAAQEAKGVLKAFEYDAGPLDPSHVRVKVRSCGICHSDLSMLNNDWGISSYPFVGGHEVTGIVEAVGGNVKHLMPGQAVGVGWFSGSCMTCYECMSGHHNRCGSAEQTIVGRHGGFADTVIAKAEWVFPLPDKLDIRDAGPLFCGGITVFSPFLINQISPLARVAVVGIGGLGHMALQFGKAWGCEVTAISHTPDKEDEARKLGAHEFVISKDRAQMDPLNGKFDMILVTVNVNMNWDQLIAMLRPGGKIHIVGAIQMFRAMWFPVLSGEKSIGGSPLGSPAAVGQMLEFCTRHRISPMTEHFPMSKINDAFEHLRNGNPRYRIVLDADF